MTAPAWREEDGGWRLDSSGPEGLTAWVEPWGDPPECWLWELADRAGDTWSDGEADSLEEAKDAAALALRDGEEWAVTHDGAGGGR